MKVILVRPPDPRGEAAFLSHAPPINLAYLAAFISQDGHEVEIWDYETEKFTKTGFINRISQAKPRIIGYGCMTPTIINGHRMARLTKENFPQIMTVLGGPHSTAWPRRSLKDFPYFDTVVIGEGEETLLELCRAIKTKRGVDGILGIAHKNAEGNIKTEERRPLIENLDELPFPRRDLLNLDLIRKGHISRGISNRLASTEIYTSRGCPIGCLFCAIGVTMGRRTRFRSPENVLAEVEECIGRYGFGHFAVMDDTFTLNSDRAKKICEGFRKLGVKSWHCEGTRVSAVKPDLLKVMAETGCRKVVFGVESGSPRILELIGKKITIEQVKNAFRWARQAGIRFIEGNYIIGSHPSETLADLEMTMSLIKETQPDFISISIIVPYPGTIVYDLMKKKGYILTENWEKFVMIDSLPSWRTEYFRPEELLNLQRKMLKSFYLRPNYIMSILSKIRSIKEMRYFTEAGSEFLHWLIKGKLAKII